MNIVLSFVALFTMLLLGVPLGLAFFSSAFVLAHLAGYDQAFFLIRSGFTDVRGVLILAVPLFILAGELMADAKIADRLIGFVEAFLNSIKIRGAQGIVATVSCALFGAVSGSTAATASAIGGMMIPRMIEKGTKPAYAASLLAAASILGIMIPPSIPMIYYGWSSNTSIAALFLGGVGPGVLIMIGLSIFHVVAVRHQPQIQEPLAYTGGFRQVTKQLFHATRHSSLTLAMPVLILGSIYGGIATATEAAAISVVYTLILGLFVYRSITLRKLYSSVASAATRTAAIMFMLFAIQILARIYTSENIPEIITVFLMKISQNRYVILILINVLYLIMGMIMDIGCAILVLTPLLLPIAKTLGLDPVHFGVFMVTALGVGYITPPVAGSLFITQSIAKCELSDMLPTIGMLILIVFVPILLIVTFVPEVSLYLPRLLGY